MALENFDIPRKDWYDSEGRIYKDALIENFNAIEEELNSLQELTPFVVSEIDWQTVEIPDVTLDSEDTSLINLKSLIDILGLDTFPAICDVSGVTITHLMWYYDGKRNNIRDRKLTISDGQFVWFKPSTGDITVVSASVAKSNITSNVEGYLLGYCNNGQLYTIYSPLLIDYDVLIPLSKMQVKGISRGGWGQGAPNPFARVSGRNLGVSWRNSKSSDNGQMIVPDVGYEPDGQRG